MLLQNCNKNKTTKNNKIKHNRWKLDSKLWHYLVTLMSLQNSNKYIKWKVYFIFLFYFILCIYYSFGMACRVSNIEWVKSSFTQLFYFISLSKWRHLLTLMSLQNGNKIKKWLSKYLKSLFQKCKKMQKMQKKKTFWVKYPLNAQWQKRLFFPQYILSNLLNIRR